MRRFHRFLAVLLLVFLFVDSGAFLASPGAAAPQGLAQPLAPEPCPDDAELIALLFPGETASDPAVPIWGLPAYSGEKDLEPLPDSFDIVERPAWFNGIPLTIRPFPRPSVGDGGPDDNHADMYIFFYPDGTPVNQPPLLEAVPLNSASGVAIPDLSARLFSANWEVHAVRVTQDYVPGTIQGLSDLDNTRWVLEDIQTNLFVTFPILPRQFTIPGLALNNLSVETGIFQGRPVSFVEYDVWENEYSEKPMYLFRKPSGEFVGDAVLSGIPGMPHYSALWEVLIVQVPADYVANTLRSEDAVLASGYPVVDGFEIFAPVESVDGMRTVFPDIDDILLDEMGRFRQDRFPQQADFPAQPWFSDPRFNAATFGFSMNITFNEVNIPRLFFIPAPRDVDALLLNALNPEEAIQRCGGLLSVPAHIARQRLIQDANGNLVHLSQSAVDSMSLAEIITRGQALFEREIFEEDGAGPAFNAYSCAACHGLPFNIGVEPAAGGPGTRFRNALQPTDTPGIKRSRNPPHVFGSGILTQLGIERGADGSDANPFPHNWKGTVPSVRAFTAGALNGEIGLQSVEKVAELAGVSLAQAATLDLDRDGKVAEMTVGDVTALTVFQVSLPRPYQVNASDSHVIRGRQIFDTVGCAVCHTPVQTLQSTILNVTNPETGGVVPVPLGPPEVGLFSDLKRHKMGSLLAEPGDQGGIPADVFRTQPLWGIADSAPYLHDGSANTLEEAIARHRGQPLDTLEVESAGYEVLDANNFRIHLTLTNRSAQATVAVDGLRVVLTTAPEGVTAVDRDSGPAGAGAIWNVTSHLAPGQGSNPIGPDQSLRMVVQYSTASGQPAELRFKATTDAGRSEALPAIEAFNRLGGGDRQDLLRFLGSLVLPKRQDLEVAAFQRLTANDRQLLGPFLGSALPAIERDPLLVAWIVNPPPEGSGKVSGQITIQVSITSEAGISGASVKVDGTLVLPLGFNPSSGFHEARLDTTTLSEGSHTISLELRDSSDSRARNQVANTAIITVDNVSDSSPQNFPSNWVGPLCVG